MPTQRSPQKSSGKNAGSSGGTPTVDPNVTLRRKPNEDPDLEEDLSMDEDLKKLINTKFNKVLLEIREIKEQYRAIETSLTFHTDENRELKLKVEELGKQNREDRIKIESLENQLEELQRWQGSTSIEIRNIPKAPNENLTTICNTVFQALDIPQKPNIRHIHRLPGKATDNKPIVVELNGDGQKHIALDGYRKHIKKDKNKRLTCDSVGFAGNYNPVYISEVLTPKMKKVFFLARQHRKLYSYKHCWTSNGRIYLRKEDGAPYILVKSEAQLNNLEKAEEKEPAPNDDMKAL